MYIYTCIYKRREESEAAHQNVDSGVIADFPLSLLTLYYENLVLLH